MLIVDHALAERAARGAPIRVGIVGAGYSGRLVAHQIINSFAGGMRLVAISNRTPERAHAAFTAAGMSDPASVATAGELDAVVRSGGHAVTDDPRVICAAETVDVVIEATGTIEFGAGVVLDAIAHGKHIILMNVELDATLGPVLRSYADRAGVVYSNSDGDEPGVAMNMIRFVRSIGLEPVAAGNLKGLYDRYRTPATQQEFAAKVGQKPAMMASFADGTKLSMELTVLANATGFRAARRGMYGPALASVNEAPAFFAERIDDGGIVDFLVGAAPGNGAWVLGRTADPVKQAYLKYLKMGDGPLYAFYTPFHLPQLEIPLTVARAALFGDATVAPLGAPVCDSIAVAKRDLRAGEVLDGLGGFTCYTLIENYDESLRINALPMGVSEGCRLVRDVPRDSVVTYNDVELPPGRICDRLRTEQNEMCAAVAGAM